MDASGGHSESAVAPTPGRRRRRWRGKSPRRKAPGTFAAIDLGTNNCRLLVARPAGRGFQVIDAFSRIIRLGEGLNRHGALGERAMERAVTALGVCAAKMRRHQVVRSRVVATEACRRADNQADFLERVRHETGLAIEVITAEEEASLAMASCAALLDPGVPYGLMFDIGGGSTELVWLAMEPDGQGRTVPVPRAVLSTPVGVVSLAERHGGGRRRAPRYDDMVADMLERLSAFPAREAVRDCLDRQELQMLGTSGTVTTLAGVHLALPRYDRRRVDGVSLELATVRELSRTIAEMTYDQRRRSPCIGPQRADLVVGGCAIVEAISRLWPVPTLRVADRGLREGILLGLMAAERPKATK